MPPAPRPSNHLQETESRRTTRRMENGDNSRDLDTTTMIQRPVNDRITSGSEERETAKPAQSLKDDLANTRDDQQETTMDKIHTRRTLNRVEIKIKTLREVRKGNTKRRVDQFENM